MNNTKIASDTKHFYDGSLSSEVRLIRWCNDSSSNLQYGLCRVYYINCENRFHTDSDITGWDTDIISDRMYGSVESMHESADDVNDAFIKNPINAWEHPEIEFDTNEADENVVEYTYWYTLAPYKELE
jgi:hypothetical protein